MDFPVMMTESCHVLTEHKLILFEEHLVGFVPFIALRVFFVYSDMGYAHMICIPTHILWIYVSLSFFLIPLDAKTILIMMKSSLFCCWLFLM